MKKRTVTTQTVEIGNGIVSFDTVYPQTMCGPNKYYDDLVWVKGIDEYGDAIVARAPYAIYSHEWYHVGDILRITAYRPTSHVRHDAYVVVTSIDRKAGEMEILTKINGRRISLRQALKYVREEMDDIDD